MGELRSALAIARKDIRNLSRYRIAVASMAFTPLYQFVIPAFLFGAAFSVGGRAPGLVATLGTDDLAGFIFLGGVIGGIVSTAFWGMAMSIRNEMDMGTLEPSWITPTAHETFVIGRAAGGLVIFVATQVALFAFGIVFMDLRLRPEMLLALPAVALALLSMVGVAYLRGRHPPRPGARLAAALRRGHRIRVPHRGDPRRVSAWPLGFLPRRTDDASQGNARDVLAPP